MTDFSDDKRLNAILDMIGRIASLDFTEMLEVSEENDMVDAISLGLNMLSEELNSQVVDKKILHEVNAKLEKFAYTVAHDLKSPLNSQAGLIKLLELTLNPDPNSDIDECITKLKRMNEKMKSLVEGVLSYSLAQSKAIEKEEVDLKELVEEVIEIDNFNEKADIEIRNELPVVFFNRTGATQIVRNLLDNAIKYSNKTRCVINIESEEKNKHYEIRFIDNGPGIPPEYQEKIFQLFNQIDPSLKTDSVGIGLATIKSIIEASGGKIWLNSKQGEGSTFIFTINKK